MISADELNQTITAIIKQAEEKIRLNAKTLTDWAICPKSTRIVRKK